MTSRKAHGTAAGAAVLALALSAPVLAAWEVSGGGTGSASATSLGTPGTPTTSSVSSSGLALSWPAPIAGPAPDRYVVRRNGAVITSCTAVTATSCTDSGLSAGTSYTYTVAAALRSWVGAQSASVTASTQAAVPTDTTPPTVTSIARAASSPTAASSAPWTVTFSEPVTGVDATDFALAAGTGLSGTGITGVTGSGATWTVTASTGSGSGTLGLNLVDDDTIKDAAANLLGGTGAGNGNRNGEVYTVDRTAPSVTVEQKAGQPDPTRSAPLLWTATFSKPVTGFDASDLTRGGTTTGGTVTVTGSGASYEISMAATGATTLSNGTTTFSIAANRAVDSAGSGNTASTSIDNTITYDTTAPTVLSGTKTTPNGGGNATRERFSGTTSEGTGTLTVNVYAGTTTTLVKSYTVTSFGGTSPHTWTQDTERTDLATGTPYRFEVVHVDAAGNTSGVFDGGAFTGN